jgi:hypothetical protein
MLLSDKEVAMDAINANNILDMGLLILFLLPIAIMFIIGALELFRGS